MVASYCADEARRAGGRTGGQWQMGLVKRENPPPPLNCISILGCAVEKKKKKKTKIHFVCVCVCLRRGWIANRSDGLQIEWCTHKKETTTTTTTTTTG